MRKQFLLLTFFALLSGQFSAQAQLRKASDYFPLKVGNMWEYDHPRQAQFQLFEVIKDTLISDTVRVYEVSRSSKLGNGPWVTGAPYFYHYNSDSTIVFRDDFVLPQSPYSGFPMLDTQRDLNSKWIYGCGDIACAYAITDTGSAAFWGQIKHWADIYEVDAYQDSLEKIKRSLRFVSGVGPVIFDVDTLTYAKINGIQYGTIVSVRDSHFEVAPILKKVVVKITPNPVYKTAIVNIASNSQQETNVRIINILGQTVRTLFDDRITIGQKIISWDGKDDYGSNLVNGVYFVVAITQSKIESYKFIYLRGDIK